MIDDHDRCEWVNVSSGTCSPGLSRTKSREPHNGCSTVVVVLFGLAVALIVTARAVVRPVAAGSTAAFVRSVDVIRAVLYFSFHPRI